MFGINLPHWHLLFNHLPVVGGMFSMLLLIYAMARRNAELKRAALLCWIVVAIVAFVSDQTGGPAARTVRDLPGVNKPMIREHAEAAEYAGILSYVMGGLGLVGLIMAARRKEIKLDTANGHAVEAYRRHKDPPQWLMLLALVVGLVQVFAMLRTANLGGEIRHPEINSDSLSRMIQSLPPHPAESRDTTAKDED
jgi:hypothetical protein